MEEKVFERRYGVKISSGDYNALRKRVKDTLLPRSWRTGHIRWRSSTWRC